MKTQHTHWMLVAMTVIAALLALGVVVPAQGGTITYTTDYANTADAPIYGQMIDPSGYYNGSGPDFNNPVTGAGAIPYGNALDDQRVYIWDKDPKHPAPAFQMMKWDMGFATDFVRVSPDVEHAYPGAVSPDGLGDIGGTSGGVWDYLQWSLWGSNNPAEDQNAWTLLWDPRTASGTSVNNFVAGTVDGAFLSANVYRYGTSLTGIGIRPGDAFGDAFTIDLVLPDQYRYIGLRTSELAYFATHSDPEINAVSTKSVPEPSTLLLLGSAIAGLALLRKKGIMK